MWAALVLSVAAAPAAASSHLLTDPADRDAFRRWFTFLSESLFFRDTAALPRDVGDCAGLVRFAYREALRKHDGRWAADLGLPEVPPIPTVRQYNFPFTPTKSLLFRISPGAWAEFADARTLMQLNARRVSAGMGRAQPGDILFYYHVGQESPYHLMVYLADSMLEKKAGPFVVYHTGPIDGKPGEVRRPALAELMKHSEPRWRPVEGNPSFRGVYRWNLISQ